VAAQIALTVTLVVGAALFVQTLNALIAKGRGFVRSSLVSFGADPLQNVFVRAIGAPVKVRLANS